MTARPMPDYFLPQSNAERKRRWRARHRPVQLAPTLLPLRGPCPTPIQAKVWMAPAGSVALSLLGRVYR